MERNETTYAIPKECGFSRCPFPDQLIDANTPLVELEWLEPNPDGLGPRQFPKRALVHPECERGFREQKGA